MRAGRIALVVVGGLLALLAVAALAAGSILLWAHQSKRDDDGYYTSGVLQLATDSYALTAGGIEISDVPDEVFDNGRFAQVRLRGSTTNGKEIFIGIAPQRDVDTYLQDVAHDEVDHVTFTGTDSPEDVEYRRMGGTGAPAPPGDQTFWSASASGPGEQTVDWDVTEGDWAFVTMNADGSEGVAVSMTVGAKAGFVLGAAIGLLAGGTIVLILGGLLIFLGARPRRDADESPPGAGPPVVADAVADAAETEPDTVVTSPYPVSLEGRLDPGLSRWLWLVKWLLAIPHFLVLFFLWIAFAVMTVVAFFAILITARYPRGIFDFNLGVLRWTWRVAFYTYSALGTDRYPPFSLGPEPDYPATLDVAHPERLSRGLVLVKWWLLAIPQYLVVGVFNGTWGFSRWGWGDWGDGGDWGWPVLGGGLIGLIVLLAAVALLFTARYPKGMFDFVIGMNRWTYRVWAYVSLMRDEYPPFRLGR